MNRNVFIAGLLSSGFNVPTVPVVQPEKVESKENPLLQLIFAPNERGCLTGDLSQFLSDKTNAEVRTFISQQLLQENPNQKGLSLSDSAVNALREHISDDDIAMFSRNHGESPEQYAYRLGKFFSDEQGKNIAKARFEREKKRLSDLGFNFD